MNLVKKMIHRESLRAECLKLFDKKFQHIKDIKDFGKIMNSETYTRMTSNANYKNRVRNIILFSNDINALKSIVEDLTEEENKTYKKVA